MKKIIMVLILLMVATSCNSAEKETDSGKLKILYWNQEMLNDDYGNLFQALYPEVEIEVITFEELVSHSNNSPDALVKRIEDAEPDVIFTRSYEEYLLFSNNDLLDDLDTWIRKDDFDIENLNPKIISLLRENKLKRLYGLAPMYSSTALFFNKTLFDQQRINYPQDQTSWDDTLLLAARFSNNNEQTYGLYFDGSIYEVVSMIGRTYGMNIVETTNDNVKIMSNSKKWENILDMLKTAFQTGELSISGPTAITSEVNPISNNLFIEGKSAMTISTTGLIEEYEQSGQTFGLGIVTIPVDPAYGDSSYTIRPNQIFGINSKSPNKQLAWDFVNFVNSDKVAKLKSKSVTGLYTRVAYSKEIFGYSLEPFYKLNHDFRIRYPLNLSIDFKRHLNELVTTEINQFFLGNQNSNETVAKIQQDGEFFYDVMKEKN